MIYTMILAGGTASYLWPLACGNCPQHFIRLAQKPGLTTAEPSLASGHYYWNSGMFMFKVCRDLAWVVGSGTAKVTINVVSSVMAGLKEAR